MQIYVMLDKLSKTIGEPIFFENDDVAVRALSNQLIKEARDNILFSPADFELHKIEGLEFTKEKDYMCCDACIVSGVKSGEDVNFRTCFVYDFAKINAEEIRKTYETDRLTKIEEQLHKFELALQRR